MEEDLPLSEHQKTGDTPVPGRKEIEPTLAFKLEPTLAQEMQHELPDFKPQEQSSGGEANTAEKSDPTPERIGEDSDRYHLPLDSHEEEEFPDYDIPRDSKEEIKEEVENKHNSLDDEEFEEYEEKPGSPKLDTAIVEEPKPGDLSGGSVLQADITAPEQPKPSSPMLDERTKHKLINLGSSLDSKKMSDAIGYLDLRQLCKSFGKAIMRHIDFSKGLYFVDDLKKLNDLMEAEGFDVSGKLDFSYNLDANMQISLNRMNKKARQHKDKLQ